MFKEKLTTVLIALGLMEKAKTNTLTSTEWGQIEASFRFQFKHCTIISVSPDLEQKQVIFEFCKLYNITMNSISEDMLRKSWQRSPQKYIIQDRLDGNKLKSKLVCPIIF